MYIPCGHRTQFKSVVFKYASSQNHLDPSQTLTLGQWVHNYNFKKVILIISIASHYHILKGKIFSYSRARVWG